MKFYRVISRCYYEASIIHLETLDEEKAQKLAASLVDERRADEVVVETLEVLGEDFVKILTEVLDPIL